MYGPGKFSVLLSAPPTMPGSPTDAIVVPGFPGMDPSTGAYPYAGPDAVPGARGYVLSMWTFSYSEVYGVPTTGGNTPDTAFPFNGSAAIAGSAIPMPPPGPDGIPVTSSIVVESAQAGTGAATNSLVSQPVLKGMVNGYDQVAVHNHEIDIEIPANTDCYGGPDMTSALSLNTANFNTWLSDTGDYGQGGAKGNPAFYQQVQAVAPLGQTFISVGQGADGLPETQDTFHELSFVWHVDPAEAGASPQARSSYVAFYRDGVEVYRCHRFVPRRSGRVIIGLWPAWWGSNYMPLTFNHVYVKIARIEFLPQTDGEGAPLPGLVTSGAQSYDLAFPVPSAGGAKEVACGFETPISQRLPCTSQGACQALSTTGSSHHQAPPAPPAPPPAAGVNLGLAIGLPLGFLCLAAIILGVLASMGLLKKQGGSSRRP
jgi:hypothetical protein